MLYKLSIKNVTLYVQANSDEQAMTIAKLVKATSVKRKVAAFRANGHLLTQYKVVAGW